MNILITSGGTRIPIDNVRSIQNFSSGKFGSIVTKHLLLAGHKVTQLHAINAPTPFEFNVNLLAHHQDNFSKLEGLQEFSKKYLKKYTEEKFDTFDDYASKIFSLVSTFKYDMIILCAAVSDYGTDKFNGKISSKDAQSIELYPLPKIIKQIRQKFTGTLVGFKLMSNVTEPELVEAAQKQIGESGSDFVVANRLEDLQQQEKRAWLVRKEGWQTSVIGSSDSVARDLLELIDL